MPHPSRAVEAPGADEETPGSLEESAVERISQGAPAGQRFESERSAS